MGQTGGVTLTLGVVYLGLLTHERNRQAQAHSLRAQSRVLNSLLEPTPLPPPQSRAELAREERSSLVETAKDRWNAEVENAVRWVQRTDWNEVREGMEGAVARLLGRGLEKSREGIEEAEIKAEPKVQEAVDQSRAAARRVAHQATAGIDRAASSTISSVKRAVTSTKEHLRTYSAETGDVVKAKTGQAVADAKLGTEEAASKLQSKSAEFADAANARQNRAVANVKSGAQEVVDKLRHSGGTVDAARGAVRDTVNRGIEKGREAIGKAQAAIGLVADNLESKAQSVTLSHSSEVEKALHERYEKSNGLNKTVEEALEERYKPIEARDNSILRGV